MSNQQEVLIVLVEDDPGHARLIEKNLRRSNITNDLLVLTDGQQASGKRQGSQGHLTPTASIRKSRNALPQFRRVYGAGRLREGARADLVPSLWEGYNLVVVESIAL